jgi:hypothetical protein
MREGVLPSPPSSPLRKYNRPVQHEALLVGKLLYETTSANRIKQAKPGKSKLSTMQSASLVQTDKDWLSCDDGEGFRVPDTNVGRTISFCDSESLRRNSDPNKINESLRRSSDPNKSSPLLQEEVPWPLKDPPPAMKSVGCVQRSPKMSPKMTGELVERPLTLNNEGEMDAGNVALLVNRTDVKV